MSPDEQNAPGRIQEPPAGTSRRDFLFHAAGGLGGIALADLMGRDGLLAASGRGGAANPLAPKRPHFPGKAKRVIYLFMHGGPSHLDLFDYKPELVRLAGQPLPASFGPVMTRRKVAQNTLMAPVRRFRPRGESGLLVSDFLPQIGACADKLCVVRSCHGDSVNHPQSVYQMNTGSILMGHASLGSWVAYGLGSENQDMPAFVVMPDPGAGLKGGPLAWGNGYLPAAYQGTPIRPGRSPILDLRAQPEIGAAQQRATLDLVQRMNRAHLRAHDADDDLAARISAYELAFRMQMEAPGILDLSRESRATLDLYGIGQEPTDELGVRCLMARRMIERGVRFVQLYSGDTNGWDAHNDVAKNHATHCARTDRPVAGLLCDLEQRGLLEDTLVIWGGEFGRMPMNEKGTGRDHNPWGYTVWFAGAGVRGGTAYGATDELGLRAAVDPVHVNDLHATILHLLGFDHERLTFFHEGRDKRLTDVRGRVVRGILA